MVGVSGLEPPASSSRTKRASHCATPRAWQFNQPLLYANPADWGNEFPNPAGQTHFKVTGQRCIQSYACLFFVDRTRPPSFSPQRESRALSVCRHDYGSVETPAVGRPRPSRRPCRSVVPSIPPPLPNDHAVDTGPCLKDKMGSGFPLRRERRGRDPADTATPTL